MSKQQWYNTPAGIMEINERKGDGGADFSNNGGKNLSYFSLINCAPITPANPLAPQILQYAYDAFEHEKPWELWEIMVDDFFVPVVEGNAMFCDGYEYRRIESKKTFMCNGVELVDDRVQEERLEEGDHIAVVDFNELEDYNTYSWEPSYPLVVDLVRKGIAHHTKEGAVAHAKALLE